MKSGYIQRDSLLYQLVAGIRYYNGTKPAGGRHSYKLFADGLVGLTFYDADVPIQYNRERSGQLILYGQTIRPLEISYESNFEMIVFYFKPYAIKYLFGINASELTDTCLDFDLVDSGLKPLLMETRDTEKRIRIIADYLYDVKLSVKNEPDQRMAYATEKIFDAGGNICLSNLRNEIFITERTFERHFLQHVGVTPAVFSKICRFNKAALALKKQGFGRLTDLAHSGGYADQSHFIRHFKEFTSITPKQYLELVKSHELI